MSIDTGTHHLGTHGWLRLVLAALLVLVFILTLEASPAAAASRKECRVRNTDTGKTYGRLQTAVKAAKSGDRLILTGTCHGGTFINRDLTIIGKKTKRTDKPVLDGRYKARVVTIKPKVKVSIRSLVIRNGKATRIPNGGGISNKGRLTLRDVVVRSNSAERGGAIYNAGVLRVQGRTIVKDNHAAFLGETTGASAIYNVGRLILDDRTHIRSNGGMFSVVNDGVLRMKRASDISRNHEGGHVRSGGVQNEGILVMNDTASIAHQGSNTNSGTLVMNDASSIHDCFTFCGMYCTGPASPGAGVHNTGSLTLNDFASIHHNVVGYSGPEYPAAHGGGVYNEGSVTMTGSSSVHHNQALAYPEYPSARGGGLYNATGGTLNGVYCAPQTYANVYGNAPDDCYFEP